jgi:hypothetical protein
MPDTDPVETLAPAADPPTVTATRGGTDLLAHERNCPEYSDLRTTLHSSRKPLLDAPRDLPLKTGSTYGLPHD